MAGALGRRRVTQLRRLWADPASSSRPRPGGEQRVTSAFLGGYWRFTRGRKTLGRRDTSRCGRLRSRPTFTQVRPARWCDHPPVRGSAGARAGSAGRHHRFRRSLRGLWWTRYWPVPPLRRLCTRPLRRRCGGGCIRSPTGDRNYVSHSSGLLRHAMDSGSAEILANMQSHSPCRDIHTNRNCMIVDTRHRHLLDA